MPLYRGGEMCPFGIGESWSRSRRIVRFHVDGPFGIGKTSAVSAMVLSLNNAGGPRVVSTPEPMKYWREFFSDLVTGVGEAAEAGKNGNALTRKLAAEAVSSLQSKFADPYLLLNDRLSGEYGPVSSVPGDPDLVLCFDRHSVASTVCFPAARFLNGNCEADCLLSLMIKTPAEAPGCNLMITDLADEEEHVRRLTARGRKGEVVDRGLLRCLRTAYSMFVSTVDYSNAACWLCEDEVPCDDEWRSVPWLTRKRRDDLAAGRVSTPRNENPRLEDTLLSLLKIRELCDSDGCPRRVHRWAATSLLKKLRGMQVTTLKMDGKSVEDCASEMAESVKTMRATRCSPASEDRIVTDVLEYAMEVGGD